MDDSKDIERAREIKHFGRPANKVGEHGTICEHKNFVSRANIFRLIQEEGGPVDHYTAEITIECMNCKMPFMFLGVPLGLSPSHPTRSADLRTLRAPIVPVGEQ